MVAPRWKIWPADPSELKADIATLLPAKNSGEPLTAKPVSAFIADGSHVEVRRRTTEPRPWDSPAGRELFRILLSLRATLQVRRD